MLGPSGDLGVGTCCLALAVGVLIQTFLVRKLKVPYPVLVLVVGVIFGGFVGLYIKVQEDKNQEGNDNIFVHSVNAWATIKPQTILFGLLPILLFGGALNCNLQLFLAQFRPVVALSVLLVVFHAFIIGGCIYGFFPYNWDFHTAMMMAGILSATDPVAVSSVLRGLGVQKSLTILVEGESLLNDATSVVIFSIFADKVMPPQENTASLASATILGGPAIGVALGTAASFLLGYMINDPLPEITVTLVVAYGAFVLSESTGAGASGVLAVMSAGLCISFYRRSRITNRASEVLRSFWEALEYLTYTMVFFISGVTVSEKIIVSDSKVQGRDAGYLVLLYLLLNLVRFVGIALLHPLVLSKGVYGIDWKQSLVLGWSGLKGGLSLILAVAVHQEVDFIPEYTRDLFMFYVAGIVFLTTIINGTTISFMLRVLGLDMASDAEWEVFVRTNGEIERRLEEIADEMKVDKYLGDADWKLVRRYLPVHTAEVYWNRLEKHYVAMTEKEVGIMTHFMKKDKMQQQVDGSVPGLSPSAVTCGEESCVTSSTLPSVLREMWTKYAWDFNKMQRKLHADELRAARSTVCEALRNNLMPEGRHDSPLLESSGSLAKVEVPGLVPRLLSPASTCTWEPGRGKADLPATISTKNTASMREARETVLTVLKHSYWAKFQSGFLSRDGLLAFEKTLHVLSLRVDQPMNQWFLIEKQMNQRLRTLQSINKWHRNVVVGPLVEHYVSSLLAYKFELAVNFIMAHEELKVKQLFGLGSVVKAIGDEVKAEIKSATRSLSQFLPLFPEYLNSVKTKIASRVLLHQYRSLVQTAYDSGAMDARHHDTCARSADDSLVKLSWHPCREASPNRLDILRRVGFLRFLETDKLEALFVKHDGLCHDVFVGPNQQILAKGPCQGVNRWYVVVRGTVIVGDKMLSSGATFGMHHQLFKKDYGTEYVAATFSHLLCFDRKRVLMEARRTAALQKSLWWYAGVRELRKYPRYADMTLGEIGELLSASRFVWVPPKQTESSLRDNAGGTVKIDSMVIITPNEDLLQSYGKPVDIHIETGGANVLLLKGSITTDETSIFPVPGVVKGPTHVEDAFGDFSLSPGSVCFLIPRRYARPRRSTLTHNEPSSSGPPEVAIVELDMPVTPSLPPPATTSSVSVESTSMPLIVESEARTVRTVHPPAPSREQNGLSNGGLSNGSSNGALEEPKRPEKLEDHRRPSALESMFTAPTAEELTRGREISPSGHFNARTQRKLALADYYHTIR